jgi:hypothetical protein
MTACHNFRHTLYNTHLKIVRQTRACRNFLLVTSQRLTFVVSSFLFASNSYFRISDYNVILTYTFIFSMITCFFGLTSYFMVPTQQVNCHCNSLSPSLTHSLTQVIKVLDLEAERSPVSSRKVNLLAPEFYI